MADQVAISSQFSLSPQQKGFLTLEIPPPPETVPGSPYQVEW